MANVERSERAYVAGLYARLDAERVRVGAEHRRGWSSTPTRATRRLGVLHTGPLPDAPGGLDPAP